MRFLATLLGLYLSIASSAFAQIPNILKITDLKPGTKAIGFSVFQGVEPQPFDVVIGETTDQMGSSFILAKISGKPLGMDIPLERIGAISGMSGSPIFIDCVDLDECIKTGTLVGALSYGIGSFIEGGMNVLLTPAEYMLGARVGGYVAANKFSNRMPNKINVGSRQFKNLMLFPEMNSLQAQSDSPNICSSSINSNLRPGSMVSVFLARGSIPFGVSGTVTWIDKDKVYIFGHQFLGSGMVNYPFVHIGVAATLQTPLSAHKIPGCSMATNGAMLVDGEYEMAGIIGGVAPAIPLKVELHMQDGGAVFNEEVIPSPMARLIINRLPSLWAVQLMGDMSHLSLAYQARIIVHNEPEIFLKNIIPAGVVPNSEGVIEDTFSELFNRIDIVFQGLGKSGFNYGIESISIHVDFTNNFKTWKKKTAFLSQEKAIPGETIYVNVVLEQFPEGPINQISIPVKIPEDFITKRIGPSDSSVIVINVQSSLKFIDKRPSDKMISISDIIGRLKQNIDLPTNVLYVRQIMPRTKADREIDKNNSKLSAKKTFEWTNLSVGDLGQLPSKETTEVILSLTPPLDNFIDFEAVFNITVQAKEDKISQVSNKSNNKNKRWFFLFIK